LQVVFTYKHPYWSTKFGLMTEDRSYSNDDFYGSISPTLYKGLESTGRCRRYALKWRPF